MNQREKKIAIIAYERGVYDERKRVSEHATHYRRQVDSARGMAITWATMSEQNGNFNVIDAQLDWN